MKDQKLTVGIEGDEVVIRIGIDTLKYATENGSGCDFETEDGENRYVVTNSEEWARSVVLALEQEEEDGTTPVHAMFEAAFVEALEQGFDGIEEKE